jgi:hypothetical protein
VTLRARRAPLARHSQRPILTERDIDGNFFSVRADVDSSGRAGFVFHAGFSENLPHLGIS